MTELKAIQIAEAQVHVPLSQWPVIDEGFYGPPMKAWERKNVNTDWTKA